MQTRTDQAGYVVFIDVCPIMPIDILLNVY